MDRVSPHPSLSVNHTAFSGYSIEAFLLVFPPLLLTIATVMITLQLVLQQEELFLDFPNPSPRMSLVSKWTPPARHFSVISQLLLKDKQHMKLFSFLSPTFPSQVSLFSHSSDLWIYYLHSLMKLGTSKSFPFSVKLWWVLMIKAAFRLLGFWQQLRALKCSFFAGEGCLEWVNCLISFFPHRTFNLGAGRLCPLPLKAGTGNKNVFFQSVIYLLEKTKLSLQCHQLKSELHCARRRGRTGYCPK